MNLKKIGTVFTSKFVGTGPSSYKKRNLPGRGLTKVEKHWLTADSSPSLIRRPDIARASLKEDRDLTSGRGRDFSPQHPEQI